MGQFGFGPEEKVPHKKHLSNVLGYHRKDPSTHLNHKIHITLKMRLNKKSAFGSWTINKLKAN